MYTRINNDGTINKDFVDGVENFISFVCNQLGVMNVREIRCPCRKCHNRKFQTLEEVKLHLFRKGFIADYYVWDRHGEQYVHATSTNFECNIHEEVDTESSNPYRQLIIDAVGPGFNVEDMEEVPNPTAQKFYDMLNAVDEKLWDGCTKHSQMSAVARLLHMKSEHHFSERCFDDFTQFLQEVLPEDNKMVDNFYRTKKLVQGLGLPVEKIDCCKNSCVIYWGEDADLTSCKFCNHPRFKNKRDSGKPNKYVPHKMMYYFPLSPRLQRLYASEATAAHMRWHDEHQQDDGTMCHPSDSEARKQVLCEWVKNLKFPDGYASNMGRYVDMRKLKLFGMKSHDCHVFMQRLLPIAFRELLPTNVWQALTELSLFFKDLTSTTITVANMERLERDIPIIICKLERIFPPGFFDSMEPLPIHLPYETRIAGPVQYRWMYPFER